jgi:WD40 repeat protein
VAAQWHDEAVLDELVGAEAVAAARVYDRAAAYLRRTGAHLAGHAMPRNVLLAALGAINETIVALGRVHRWRLADGTPLGDPLPGHYRDARTISCGRWDGRPIAVTGGFDGTVRVWDLDAGRQLHRIPLEEPVHAVALADDLSILVGTDARIGVLRLENRRLDNQRLETP